LLATITVTGTGDTIANDGLVTLREAITAANTNAASGDAPGGSPGLDTIAFDIPGPGVHTIRLTSNLPAVTDRVVIDGYTQGHSTADPSGGARPNTNPVTAGSNAVLLIELSPATPYSPNTGLTIKAAGSTVRGLAVNGFLSGYGIVLQGSGDTVAGNYLGTDVTGTIALGNDINVFVQSPNDTIGGTAPADRNLISGSQDFGINAARDETAAGMVIRGNFIGTDATGTRALPNRYGAFIEGGAGAVIGGTAAGARNLISGNRQMGLYLSGLHGTLIQGNFIGSDVSGTARLGNADFGVRLAYGYNNTVGGTEAGAGNVIAAGIAGLGILSEGDDVVQGNFIGTDVTGTIDLGDSSDVSVGVDLLSAPNRTTIGGTAAGAGNTIAFYQNGVALDGIATVLGNSIFGNRGPGIVEFASEAPLLPSPPTLTSVTAARIAGTHTGGFGATYRIEFFATPDTGGASGSQGKTFLGATDVTGDASGLAGFSFAPAGGVPAGRLLTATATDANGTSLFSRPLTGTAAPGADVSVTGTVGGGPAAVGQDLTYRFTAVDNGPGDVVGATLRVTLPGNLSFKKATSTAGAPAYSQGIVTSDLGHLTPGSSASLTVVVTPTAEGPASVKAVVSKDGVDFVPVHDTAVVSAPVAPAAPAAPIAPTIMPPLLLKDQNGLVQLLITWSYPGLVGGGVTFNVYRSTTPGGEGSVPRSKDIANHLLLESRLATASTYYYQVSAVSGGVEGPRSAEIYLTIPPAAPVQVNGFVRSEADGSLSIVVTWGHGDDPSGPLTYNVYRSTTPGGEGSVPRYANVKSQIVPDAGVVPGVTYYYQVSAVVRGVESARSAEVHVTGLPAAPVSGARVFQAAADGSLSILFYWDHPSDPNGSVTFNVYRSTTPGGEGSVPRQANVVNHVVRDAGVVPGVTYYYQVSAVVRGVESARSAEAPITVPSRPTGRASAVSADALTANLLVQVLDSYPAGSSYNFYMSTYPGVKGAGLISAQQGPRLYRTFPRGKEARTVYFQVSVTVNGVEGPRSNDVPATIDAIPFPPLILNAFVVNKQSNGANISFTVTYPAGAAPPDPSARFSLYSSRNHAGKEVFLFDVGTLPVANPSFIATFPLEGYSFSSYYFQISVVQGGAEGPRSKEVQVVVPPLRDEFPTPILNVYANILTARADVSSKVSYDVHSAPPDPPAEFRIYRSTAPGAEVLVNIHSVVDPAISQSFLRSGHAQTYYYQVSVLKDGVEGPRSNEVKITIPAASYADRVRALAVTSLYANVLHRSPETDGLQFWVTQLDSGVPLAVVSRAIRTSPEARTLSTTHP